MGKVVGIEDSDGATVGSIVGTEVEEERLSPSSSLVPGEEVGKPGAGAVADTKLVVVVLGSTVTSGSELVI